MLAEFPVLRLVLKRDYPLYFTIRESGLFIRNLEAPEIELHQW